MAESLTTEHAYLSVSSFPIVVLTEAGVLSDSERARVTEHLEVLIQEGAKQVFIIDLSEGAQLPESQRIYVAEALKLLSKDISEVWVGLGIVVGSTPEARAKAEFWLEVSPVPGRVFETLEPAMAWARGALGLGPSVRPSAAARSDPRGARVSRLSEPRPSKTTPSMGPPVSKIAAAGVQKGKASKRTGLLGWLLSPRGLLVVGAVSVAVVLLLLGPPPEDSLSGSDAALFSTRKSEFAIRVNRLPKDGKQVVLTTGDRAAVGDRLVVEMDLPAPGYTMLFGQKAGGPLRAMWPSERAGRVQAGKGLRPPRWYTVDDAIATEMFFVAYCGQRFRADECTLSGPTLKCPEDCVTKGFIVDK